MRSFSPVGVALALVAIGAPGCAAGRPAASAGPVATATIGPGGVQEVTVDDVDGMRFVPSLVRVRPGRVRVTMRNLTALPHTFTIDGLVDSGNVNGSQTRTVSFTVTRAGRLTFYCAYHRAEGMVGTLVVQ